MRRGITSRTSAESTWVWSRACGAEAACARAGVCTPHELLTNGPNSPQSSCHGPSYSPSPLQCRLASPRCCRWLRDTGSVCITSVTATPPPFVQGTRAASSHFRSSPHPPSSHRVGAHGQDAVFGRENAAPVRTRRRACLGRESHPPIEGNFWRASVRPVPTRHWQRPPMQRCCVRGRSGILQLRFPVQLAGLAVHWGSEAVDVGARAALQRVRPSLPHTPPAGGARRCGGLARREGGQCRLVWHRR